MTREEAKVGGHHRAKEAAGTKKEGSRKGRWGQTTKTQTKKTFRCFFYFLPCLVLVWSALVRSSLFLTHAHIHTCICVCFLSVSLCENRKEKKKLLNPCMILRCTYESFLSLSFSPQSSRVLPFSEGQIDRLRKYHLFYIMLIHFLLIFTLLL